MRPEPLPPNTEAGQLDFELETSERAFLELHEQLQAIGIQMDGLSPQDPEWHRLQSSLIPTAERIDSLDAHIKKLSARRNLLGKKRLPH